MNNNEKLFWEHHLHYYVEKYVLKEYGNKIEEYGVFEGKYYKLSDELIKAIQTDAKEYIGVLRNVNQEYVRKITESRDLYYSKKLHGQVMLNKIEPSKVAAICNKYFSNAYYALSGL